MEVQTRGHIRGDISHWRAVSIEDSQSTQFLSHPVGSEAAGASDSSAADGAPDGISSCSSSWSSCSRMAQSSSDSFRRADPTSFSAATGASSGTTPFLD